MAAWDFQWLPFSFHPIDGSAETETPQKPGLLPSSLPSFGESERPSSPTRTGLSTWDCEPAFTGKMCGHVPPKIMGVRSPQLHQLFKGLYDLPQSENDWTTATASSLASLPYTYRTPIWFNLHITIKAVFQVMPSWPASSYYVYSLQPNVLGYNHACSLTCWLWAAAFLLRREWLFLLWKLNSRNQSPLSPDPDNHLFRSYVYEFPILSIA